MSKITVKHYLNTNLKPYIINGEKYYSIYVLVTANRQNTKVKSRAFNEYYSEKDFAEIVSIDNDLIVSETETIINIAELLILETESFDTTLFSAVYNYYQSIYIFDLDIEQPLKYYKNITKKQANLFNKNNNKLGLGIDAFFIEPFSMNENQSKGMSIFTWYSSDTQIKLRNFLVENDCKYNIDRTIEILNKIVFYSSLDKLNWIFKGSKKYKILTEKYSKLFELSDENIKEYYIELSI